MTPRNSQPAENAAERVVLSYPADLSSWGRDGLDSGPFRAYLGKTLGEVEEGQITEQFLDAGCCGDTLDVPLRVERVAGGQRVDADTDIEYEVREGSGVHGGWRVQSAGGPTE